jgi:cytoskeletal protein RodZ
VELELHFGNFLRRGREARGLSIAELSRATKIKETNLELLEGARLDALPAQVFVRGFVTSYARAVGLDADEAMRRYRAHVARVEHRDPEVTVPHKAIQPAPVDDDVAGVHRGRLGVVMVVLLILVVATLTLSLLLRHGAGAGAGLS